MSAYPKILAQFRKLGYTEESSLQEFDINKAMDTICSKNTGFSQFDRDIAQELWEHSSKDSPRTVQLRNYINTIIQAEKILKEQIGITEQNIRRQNESGTKKQLQQQLANLLEDHRVITSPFGLPPIRQSEMIIENNIETNPMRQSQKRGEEGIFTYDANEREDSSADLKVAFVAAVIVLVWELVMMFHRHHFFNVLVLFGVLSIYFLNYFDKGYIRLLLILLGGSIILDLIWFLVMVGHYWNPNPETQHSTLHSGFLKFIIVMTWILMVARGVLLGIFFKYRDNAENFKKSMHMAGYTFRLDGKPTYNPFTPLLDGVLRSSQY